MRWRNCAVAVSLIGAALSIGCAYRLPPYSPASQELIHVIAASPEQYTVRVNTGTVREYEVPHDGRIKVGIPPYRRSCAVYLFNAIKVKGYGDPLNGWIVSITRNGKTVRQQSLRVTQKSPMDEAGYYIVKIAQRYGDGEPAHLSRNFIVHRDG